MNDKQAELRAQLKEVASLLNKIESTFATERKTTIGLLQNKIWDEPALQTDELYFLQDLAGDLNFYEPIDSDRDTEFGYYDDDRLLEVTAEALKTIDALLTAS